MHRTSTGIPAQDMSVPALRVSAAPSAKDLQYNTACSVCLPYSCESLTHDSKHNREIGMPQQPHDKHPQRNTVLASCGNYSDMGSSSQRKSEIPNFDTVTQHDIGPLWTAVLIDYKPVFAWPTVAEKEKRTNIVKVCVGTRTAS